MGEPMAYLLLHLLFLLYAILPKSQALHRKFTSPTSVARPVFVQPLRHACGVPPPLPRGGFGSPRKVNGFARGSPTRGNGDDRRQWRKQGGAVGAAASKMQAERGGCWEPQPGLVERSETERLYEGKPFLCRKVRLLASPVSFWRKEWYNGFAALPAHLFGRGGEKNGKYSFFYTVCRSKCSSLLYLQVA